MKQQKTNNKAAKLKTYNRWLGFSLILITVSGIQLEATSGQYCWSVWTHIILGLALTILSLYHIYLHYKSSNWFKRFAKHRSSLVRILWWVFLLTAITGIIATIQWLDGFTHSKLGAVHGKIGFLMALLAIIHAVKQARRIHSQKAAF